MKVLFAYAEGIGGKNGILEKLDKLDRAELPLMLFVRIHKLLMEFRGEASIYFTQKENILKNLCTMSEEKKMWLFPKPGDEKYPEFEQRWNELMNAELEFNYSPIDYMAIIEKTPEEIKNKITVTGKDFDVLDAMNDLYKKENSPPEANASAGEANNGALTPTPDA